MWSVAAACLAGSPAVDLQPHQHVLPRGQAFVQVVRLEDEAEPAPQGLLCRRSRPRSVLPKQADRSVLHLAQAAHQGQHRRLARPGRPHQDGQAAARHRQRRRRRSPACAPRRCRTSGSGPLDDRSGPSEQIRRIGGAQAARGDGARCGSRPGPCRRRPAAPWTGCHGDRQAVSPAPSPHRCPVATGAARDKAEHAEDQRLLEDDAEEEAVRIAHRLEGRIFAQVVGDIGRQHLIDDDQADKHADRTPKPKITPVGRCVVW